MEIEIPEMPKIHNSYRSHATIESEFVNRHKCCFRQTLHRSPYQSYMGTTENAVFDEYMRFALSFHTEYVLLLTMHELIVDGIL